MNYVKKSIELPSGVVAECHVPVSVMLCPVSGVIKISWESYVNKDAYNAGKKPVTSTPRFETTKNAGDTWGQQELGGLTKEDVYNLILSKMAEVLSGEVEAL